MRAYTIRVFHFFCYIQFQKAYIHMYVRRLGCKLTPIETDFLAFVEAHLRMPTF